MFCFIIYLDFKINKTVQTKQLRHSTLQDTLVSLPYIYLYISFSFSFVMKKKKKKNHRANSIVQAANKKTIVGNDIIQALNDVGLKDFADTLTQELESKNF